VATVDQAVQQMRAAGLPQLPDGHPRTDGKIHRFGPSKKSWYVLHELQLANSNWSVFGAFGTWQGTGNNTTKIETDWTEITPAERVAIEQRQRQQQEKENARRQDAAQRAANRAKSQWMVAATEGVSDYAQRKQITTPGMRFSPEGDLLIPAVLFGESGPQLVGLQKICADGAKRFNTGMAKQGSCCPIGKVGDNDSLIFVAEGYATGRTVRMDSDESIAGYVAFDAGNLIHVARMARAQHPDKHILFFADDDFLLEPRMRKELLNQYGVIDLPIDGQDHESTGKDGMYVCRATWKSGIVGLQYIELSIACEAFKRIVKFENTGRVKAHEAAAEVGNASVAIPSFSDRGAEKLTDWNDLRCVEGVSVCRAQIACAVLTALMPPQSNARPLAAGAHNGAEILLFPGVGRESPPPPGMQGETPDFFPGGEGEGESRKKEKPKKVYGQDHWDQVTYVLDNFILIYGEDLVWDVGQRMLMKISSMRTIVQNSDVMKFWGGDARKWVLKRNIVFDPLETPSPAVSGPTATVNLFSGWQMRPARGASLRIQTLLLHLCDGNEDLMLWILRWLAYPLRNRGAKMETSIIMHGDEGSGKNFFFEKVVKKIYGEYGYVIGNAQLESQFNDWASMKLFMVADEVVTRSELRHMKGKLKYLISGETIIINPKGLPEHSEANHMNFVFLSNELQPLALDKTDRRYLVIWTPPALSKDFYIEVADEIDAGGIEAFYHYLMHDVDMGDFNEHTKPLYTDAKDNLIEKSLTPPERFYRDWSRGFLPLPFITVGVNQLYDAYKVWCDRSGEPKYISLHIFSPTIERYAGDVLEKRLIKYGLGHVVKQRTVFLIGEQPTGRTLADWAADASALFETDLKAYRSRSFGNVEDQASH
jgi:putative DNA primase/helicase